MRDSELVLVVYVPWPTSQFGPFWSQVFGTLGLYTVYGAWWFLLILAFLVVSTSLCIARNTPKILADLRTFKESVREQSLLAFHHKAEAQTAESPELAQSRIGTLLTSQGWRVKVQTRGNGVMLAAKKGAVNKIGYIAAHSAIVLILIGGVLDGNAMVRLAMWAQGKQLYTGSGFVADVRPQHRLMRRQHDLLDGRRRGRCALAPHHARRHHLIRVDQTPRGRCRNLIELQRELTAALALARVVVAHAGSGILAHRASAAHCRKPDRPA